MNRVKLLIGIIFFYSLNIVAQVILCGNATTISITEEAKSRVLASLNDLENSDVLSSLFAVRDYKIVEASDILVNRIWNDNIERQPIYLLALDAIEHPNTIDFTNRFIAKIDSMIFIGEEYEVYYLARDRAVEVLFNHSDYSKANYVFETINKMRPRTDYISLKLLKEIAINVSELREQAKVELISISENSSFGDYRLRAIYYIENAFGAEAIPTIKKVFYDDEEPINRMSAIKLLLKYKTSYVNSIIRERIIDEPEEIYRINFAQLLLKEFGSASDYKFIIEAQNANNIPSIDFYVRIILKLTKPDSTTTIETMLDTLGSYTTQSYNYDWLKDESFKNELLNKIVEAKNKLNIGDSLNCKIEIEAFKSSVAQVFADSVGSYPKYISDAGYKFMYYQAEYILERLPETTEPPTEFNPIAFVDTLLSYNTQCLSNGWLSAAWVHTVLKSSLDNAKTMLELNQPQSAIQIMEQFNSILDSYKASNFVTTEGYNLLKLNSDFLIAKLDSLINAPQNVEAFALLDIVLEANETCHTEGWYSATWVYTNFSAMLNNATITLEQNNPIGCKGVMEGFVSTLDAYKTSGFVTEEGYAHLKPKCLELITELSN